MLRPLPSICLVGEELLRASGFVNCPIVQVIVTAPGHPGDPHLQFSGRISSIEGASVVAVGEGPVTPSTLMSSGNGLQLPRRGKEFSPTEEVIMRAVTDQWQTKHQLAAACGMTASTSFCAILANLVEREYLESGGRGYRLRLITTP